MSATLANVRIFVVRTAGGDDHVGLRHQQIVFLSKGYEQATRSLGFDITAQRSTACPECHRMRNVSQRCWPLGKMPVGIHNGLDFAGKPRPTKIVTGCLNISGLIALSFPTRNADGRHHRGALIY